MLLQKIEIYTDGSCHTQQCLGAWVAIVFIAGEKVILSGKELNTTHNRMELTAVIKTFEYIQQSTTKMPVIKVVTDSQYVTGLQARSGKFSTQNFITKKGTPISNADLVMKLLALTNALPVEFVKIKAHQKNTAVINYNIEADKLSRNIVRLAVKELKAL